MTSRKCLSGCTCKRHSNGRYISENRKCREGCTCNRHTPDRVYTPRSEEVKKKISESLRGRTTDPHSEETKKKISQAHTGRVHSEEFREKCRQRQQRLLRDPEYYDRVVGALVKSSQSRGRKEFWEHDGYVLETTNSEHILAIGGLVLQHRRVLYEFLECESLDCSHSCHWCGVELTWGTKFGICVDHLDRDKKNNNPENLVVSCLLCNWNRDNPIKEGPWSEVLES